MIKQIINIEDNTITTNELEDIIKDNFPVAMRSKLEVYRPYEDATYKIIKDANYYHLVNINILSVVYTSSVSCTLLDFIKELIKNNYIVKIQIDDDEED